jgi:hypothetical protein
MQSRDIMSANEIRKGPPHLFADLYMLMQLGAWGKPSAVASSYGNVEGKKRKVNMTAWSRIQQSASRSSQNYTFVANYSVSALIPAN